MTGPKQCNLAHAWGYANCERNRSFLDVQTYNEELLFQQGELICHAPVKTIVR